MPNMMRRLLILLLLTAPLLASAQQAPVATPPTPAAPLCEALASVEALPTPADLSELALLAQEMQPHEWVQEGEAAYDAEKHRTIDKTYKVSKNDLLDIGNKFGTVRVNTWSKDEMRVKVDVIARASTDSKAQEILDNIKIVEVREGNTISFTTQMSPMHISGHSNKSFEVNYTVYMPSVNPLTVSNTYGDVYLADLQGKADISVKYGALKSERLNNSNNSVKIAYGSGDCSFINGGDIQVAYSNMNLNGTNGLQGSSKYSDFTIGNLGEELNLEVKYGSFKVSNVSKNIRLISLDSGFTPIALNFEDNTSFHFDVNLQFGDFKVDQSLINLTSQEKGYTSAVYKGSFGGAAAKGSVNINAKYGDVKFTH